MNRPKHLIQLAQRFAPSANSAPADTELLHCYANERDETAFAELVRRNGPLVLRACRHILGEAHADDAFQSVFLLLARSADQLTRPGSLAGWLHAAAVRISLRARRGEERRRKHEMFRNASPTAPNDLTWKEVREVLDVEIAALPERYQLPLVLCYLEELTHEEAAGQIGCAVGVLRGRLNRGRERLRRRLERYGLPLAAPVLVIDVPSPVSAALAARTIRTVMTSTEAVVPSAPGAFMRFTLWWRAMLLAPGIAALAFVLAAAIQPNGDPPASDPPLPKDRPAAKAALGPATDLLGDPLPPGAIARLGSARFHHGENNQGVIVGADGKLVASVGGYRGYKLWAGDTGKSVPLWDELAKASQKMGWFQIIPVDGGLAAVVNDQDGTRLVDPVTGKFIRTLPRIASFPTTPGLAPNGTTLVAVRREQKAGDIQTTLRMWEAGTEQWTDLDNAVGDPHQNAFHFSADSKTLAFHKFDGAIDVWDLPSAKCVLRLPATRQRVLEAFTLSADGALLAREAGAKLQVWNVKTGKELPVLADQPKLFGLGGLAFSPDGRVLAGSGNMGSIRLWDVAAGKKLRDIQGHGYMVRDVVFSGDGKRLYVADGNGVNVWDPLTGKPLDDVGGHRYMIHDAMWSPDGKRLVSSAGYTDNVARVWDPTTGRKLFDIVGHKSSVTYSPDGSLLATGGQDGSTRLLDSTTGKELHSFAAKDGDVYALAFTPDGRFLVTGGRKALHVWDVAERKEARSIPNNGDVPIQINFLRDGQSVMVYDWGSKTRVIDFATGREETPPAKEAERTKAVAVSPADRYLADADKDGTTHLVDAVTGREILAITGQAPTQENPDIHNILGLSVSPDGRTVASAHRWAELNRPFTNGEMRVYEVASGAELFRFIGHTDEVIGVRFSPEGNRLCSFAADHTLLIWDVTGTRQAPAPAPKSADTAWADLMSADAKKGFAAIRYLSADPPAALRLITTRVKPIATVDPKAVTVLIEKLGSSEFAEREAASKELATLAPAAVDQLRQAIGKSDSPEVRARLDVLLSGARETKLSGEPLRAVRAIEVLERVGTPEARKVLAELASGTPGAKLTRDAGAALTRMKSGK